jgi:hypothetical protein
MYFERRVNLRVITNHVLKPTLDTFACSTTPFNVEMFVRGTIPRFSEIIFYSGEVKPLKMLDSLSNWTCSYFRILDIWTCVIVFLSIKKVLWHLMSRSRI